MSRVSSAVAVTEIIKAFIAISMSLLLGCSSKFEVNGVFPEPVIDKIPLVLGVIYEPEFASYRYIEKDEQRMERDIGIGKAQVKLFNTVLNAMFLQVLPSTEFKPSSNDSVDMFFHPVIEEFQYNVPRETKVNVFEVWMKYHLRVFDSQGQLIADWIQTAYGKTPSAMFKSQEKALNEAMIVALRDLGASLSLRFFHVPEINSWLKQRRQVMTRKLSAPGKICDTCLAKAIQRSEL